MQVTVMLIRPAVMISLSAVVLPSVLTEPSLAAPASFLDNSALSAILIPGSASSRAAPDAARGLGSGLSWRRSGEPRARWPDRRYPPGALPAPAGARADREHESQEQDLSSLLYAGIRWHDGNYHLSGAAP